jgi:predicted Zn-dependent peptidase
MIQFEKFTLENGLRVLVHRDESTPMAVVNVIYDVGARDEDPEKTGFAHLFEHLMFGGQYQYTGIRRTVADGRGREQCFYDQ